MTDTDCVLGTKNEQRIVSLERDMSKVSKMVYWLVTSSFATLASVIVGLLFTFVKG